MLKRVIRRSAAAALSQTGISLATADDLLRALGRFKWQLVGLLVISIAAPLLEIGFIAMLYAMVSPSGQQQMARKLADVGFSGLVTWLATGSHYWAFVIAAAGGMLGALIASRLFEHYRLNYLKYYLDVTYMHRVVEAYLDAPPMTMLRVDRHRVTSAVLSESIGYGVFAFNALGLVSLGMSVAMFLVSAVLVSFQLLLVTGVVSLFTMFIARRAYRVARTLSTQRVAIQTELVARLADVINGFRVAKIEGAEPRLSRSMRDFLFTSQRWRIKKGHNEMSVTLASEGLLYVALLLIVTLSLLVFRIDSSVLLIFLVLMGRLQKYIGSLQQRWLQLKAGSSSLDAVQEVIAACTPVSQSPRASSAADSRRVPNLPLTIKLNSVSFTYPQGSLDANGEAGPVIREVTLELRSGDLVLIQGPSGQGKSTLVHLVSGLLVPTDGSVTYNGEPLDAEIIERLRGELAYAAPDLHVFRASIRENLCIARDYPDEEIVRAARLAGLESVVAGLPNGLDSFIGENGNQLSLGERQRVLLARVFLKRPRIALLDEATSNLDRSLEAEVLANLVRELGPGGVLLMVTHKQPAGVPFTREYVIQHGQLRDRLAEPVRT